jgi:hypothetical protein
MVDVAVIESPDTAATALDPIKTRLLSELAVPASAASLADRVGLTRPEGELPPARAGKALGVVDRLALLKLWAEDTPRSIFPQRRIGFLREGYEASFLALEGNPLDDWRNIRRIKLRFKQGVEVQLSDR